MGYSVKVIHLFPLCHIYVVAKMPCCGLKRKKLSFYYFILVFLSLSTNFVYFSLMTQKINNRQKNLIYERKNFFLLLAWSFKKENSSHKINFHHPLEENFSYFAVFSQKFLNFLFSQFSYVFVSFCQWCSGSGYIDIMFCVFFYIFVWIEFEDVYIRTENIP